MADTESSLKRQLARVKAQLSESNARLEASNARADQLQRRLDGSGEDDGLDSALLPILPSSNGNDHLAELPDSTDGHADAQPATPASADTSRTAAADEALACPSRTGDGTAEPSVPSATVGQSEAGLDGPLTRSFSGFLTQAPLPRRLTAHAPPVRRNDAPTLGAPLLFAKKPTRRHHRSDGGGNPTTAKSPNPNSKTFVRDSRRASFASPPSEHMMKTHYPMLVMPIKSVLRLEKLLPHQEALELNLLVPYNSLTMAGRIIFVSHQCA